MTDSPNPEELATEVMNESRGMRESGEVKSDLQERLDKTFERFETPMPDRNSSIEGLRAAVWRAHDLRDITHESDPSNSRPVIGPVITFFKKLVLKAITWAIKPTADRSRDFAYANVDALEAFEDRLRVLEAELVRLQEIPVVTRDRVEEMWKMWERMGGVRLDERLGRVERMQRHLSDKVDSGAMPARSDDGAPVPSAPMPRVERVFDYYLFQVAHRGGPEMLEERERRYLPYFKGLRGVLDFGCGRGEFLDAFKAADIKAYGVEIHPDMVAECRERGLEVIEGDGMEHIRNLEPNSIGGIFLGQVVEHLDPAELVELVERSYEVISPGGVFLAETVNPTCLGSFAHAFYIDLSHDKPVHPTTMKFLLESSGFGEVTYEWMFPFPEEVRMKRLEGDEPWIASLNENIDKVNQLLWGPHDYAVIGRKPS